MHSRVKNLVNGAMLAALIAAATMALRLPLPQQRGYCSLGDSVILLSFALPPVWAAGAAAAGSVLSDVLLGSAAYAPATALIKGVMGWIAGKWLGTQKTPGRRLLSMALTEGWMTAGYFLFEWAAFGIAAAGFGLPGNAVQAALSIGLALLMQKPLERIHKMMKTR